MIWSSRFLGMLPLLFLPLLFACASDHPTLVYADIAKLSKVPSFSLDKVPPRTLSSSELLWYQEIGRLNFLVYATETSADAFASAIDYYKEQELTAQRMLNAPSILGIVTNDTRLRYDGSPFERVLVHHYQAMNYLRRGHLDSAMVEIRAASNQQRYILMAREKEIAEAKSSVPPAPRDLVQAQNMMDKYTREITSAYLNGYTFFFSALVREISGDRNGAYIDYKKAYTMSPSPLIANDIARLVDEFGHDDDKTRFLSHQSDAHDDKARVIVFYEQGLVPPLQELIIRVFIWDMLYSMALPVYTTPMPRISTLSLGNKEESVAYLTNIYAMQMKNLSDKYPIIFARAFVRQAAKVVARRASRQAAQGGGSAGLTALAAGIAVATHASEHADLRSWLTLPAHVQVASLYVDAGDVAIPVLIDGIVRTTLHASLSAGDVFIATFVAPDSSHVSLVPLWHYRAENP